MIIGAAIVLKIILLFILAWNSRFVMDEFWQLGNAKYVFNGFFDTIIPGKAIGYAAFYKLAHLIGSDAKSILLIGRIQTALLGCAIVAMVYMCARSLGEGRLRALLIVLILLSFSNFLERIFRTIAEPLAVFFGVAALLVILRGPELSARRIFAAGILSGCSFLATQKALYFNVALGLALVGDAILARRLMVGVARGAWLVIGWVIPAVVYCVIFGGRNPLPVAENLLFGPAAFAARGAAEYGSLRHYLLQTLGRNALLYMFCFAGMGLAAVRIGRLDERRRIALIFSVVITALVFGHSQPWPYVFIMALPFMALWSLAVFDTSEVRPRYRQIAYLVLAIAVVASFVGNVRYLRIDNPAQLALVTRAESMLRQDEHYFDGTGMVPNRRESTPLWLDRHRVLLTLEQRESSEVYQALMRWPPKLIIWSYRMDGISPIVFPLIRNSYVQVAPNVRLAGRPLRRGEQIIFDVPIAGTYALYNEHGQPLRGDLQVDGAPARSPIQLRTGPVTVVIRTGPQEALLLLEGSYVGQLERGNDNDLLFAGVYD